MSWAEVRKINGNFRVSIDEMLYTNIFYPLLGMGKDGEFDSTGNVTPTLVDSIVMYECTDFTLNQGHILKPTTKNKGILIRCMGTCTINGTIDQRDNAIAGNYNSTGTPWVSNSAIDLPPKYYLPLSGTDAIIKNRFILPVASGGAGGRGGDGGKYVSFDQGDGAGSNGGSGGAGGTSAQMAFGGNAGGGGGGGAGNGTQYPQTTPVGGNGVAGIGAVSGVAGTGGAGGASATNVSYKGGTGGNGGLGAGNVIIIAKNIIIGVTGSILAYGTNGTAGTAGASNCGGGGGGGGGNGGSIAFFYSNTYSKLGTVNNAGGTGGAGGLKGSPTNLRWTNAYDGASGGNGSSYFGVQKI